jgi:uncharacterized membrane protein YgcG
MSQIGDYSVHGVQDHMDPRVEIQLLKPKALFPERTTTIKLLTLDYTLDNSSLHALHMRKASTKPAGDEDCSGGSGGGESRGGRNARGGPESEAGGGGSSSSEGGSGKGGRGKGEDAPVLLAVSGLT